MKNRKNALKTVLKTQLSDGNSALWI